MPTIYLHLVDLDERQSENITGARFTIEYASGRRAEVSMLDMPPVSGSAPFDDFRAELDQLGRAIQGAARSPQNIYTLAPPRTALTESFSIFTPSRFAGASPSGNAECSVIALRRALLDGGADRARSGPVRDRRIARRSNRRRAGRAPF
jgi:hypothetical protein